MVTAKSLQMLDTLGNNISPAVNIETLYYEKEEAGIIYRNHIFKHFPVYVKYSGHPVVKSVADDYHADSIYQSIIDYQASMTDYAGSGNYVLPDVGPEAFDWNFAVSGAELKENKGNEVYNDILISGMVQSPLAGTDFYKLDVSTYNLTKILSNYAPKEWVRLNDEFQNAKIENADKYQSPAYLQKNRSTLKIVDPIGGIEAGVDVSTLCGQTYSNIIDQIITPVKNPKVSQTRIKLIVPRYIHLKKEDINKITPDKVNSKYPVQFDYKLEYIEFPKWETFKMGTESLIQPTPVISQVIVTPHGSYSRVYNTDVKNIVDFKNIAANVTLDIAANTNDVAKLGSIRFSYPTFDEKYITGLYNSIGNPAYASVTDIIQYLQTGSRISVSIKRDSQEGYSVSQYPFPGGDGTIDLTTNLETTFPIMHGHSLKKLEITRISGLKYHQIYTKIDPTKNYYICVPKILSAQLFNPIPYLYKILQQSKWQMANNWSVINISNNTEGFEGFIVYTIAKQGIGMSKEIKFVINMTPNNVNVIRIQKAKDNKQKQK